MSEVRIYETRSDFFTTVDAVRSAVQAAPTVHDERSTPAGTQFLLYSESRPTWQILVAICLFPFGLAALLAGKKREAAGTVTVTSDGGSRQRIVGQSAPWPVLANLDALGFTPITDASS